MQKSRPKSTLSSVPRPSPVQLALASPSNARCASAAALPQYLTTPMRPLNNLSNIQEEQEPSSAKSSSPTKDASCSAAAEEYKKVSALFYYVKLMGKAITAWRQATFHDSPGLAPCVTFAKTSHAESDSLRDNEVGKENRPVLDLPRSVEQQEPTKEFVVLQSSIKEVPNRNLPVCLCR